jgi:hypothetical protein
VLEIGAYDGVSSNMMLDEIFTHPESEVHTVDPYISDPSTPGVGAHTRERFEENWRRGGHGDRIQLYEGLSVEVMGWMIAEEGFWEGFDVIFIDGSHLARDVMTDATMAWHLLKPGGMMVFDDYTWGMHLPSVMRPKEAIDAFVAAFSREIVPVWSGSQKFIRKAGGDLMDEKLMGRKCAIIGGYCSGVEKVARAMEGFGFRLGEPLWDSFAESVALRERLVRWWDEPKLEKQVSSEEVVRGLREWLEEVSGGVGGVCASHPLLAFCLPELEEAWGSDTLLIRVLRPLEDSIEALEKTGWFPEAGRMQRQLDAAMEDWFAGGSPHYVIRYEDWVGEPDVQRGKLLEVLGMEG